MIGVHVVPWMTKSGLATRRLKTGRLLRGREHSSRHARTVQVRCSTIRILHLERATSVDPAAPEQVCEQPPSSMLFNRRLNSRNYVQP